jgi:acetyl-CoA C-acetyltransferase/acetyl-CoA acyltransferase
MSRSARPVIVDGVRTPFGDLDGAFSDLHAQDLAVKPLEALETRIGFDGATDVEDVIYGCVAPKGEQGNNIARFAPLLVGWGDSVPGVQVNRACGSGQQAANFAASLITTGVHDVLVAGGVEHMTRVLMRDSESLTMDSDTVSDTYYEHFDELMTQGEGAEQIADGYNLTRREVDRIAVDSQHRWADAVEAGHLDHVIPVEFERDGETVPLEKDEHPRPDTDLKTLGTLPLQFREEGDGVIHAGNASGIVDGAAALLLSSQETAAERGWDPLAEIVDMHVVGVDPITMLTGPIPATNELLERNEMTDDDIDLFEVNEAFAPVISAWLEDTGADWERTNVWGGAIAHGHPLGATGATLLGKLAHQLQEYDYQYGVCTMCIGMGQGIATLIKRA